VKTKSSAAKNSLPLLIQGGMGVGVSDWRLARAVAQAGAALGKPVLGVVSGTGLAIIMVNRLRKGDADARRALEAFPVPEIAQEAIARYWLRDAKSAKAPPKPEVFVNGRPDRQAELARLLVLANFSEVWLAKEGHDQPVGVNYLEKIQVPRLPELFGAILGDVDYVLMGAGIPNQVPGVLDRLHAYLDASYRIDVAGSDRHIITFDPKSVIPEDSRRPLRRPRFLAIVAHHALAQVLAAKASGEVNGFVVEGPTAGGHNAPARGKERNERGEPVYGERDQPDLARIAGLGKPFWMAGGFAGAEGLAEARHAGAAGIQVGSIFALCDESGLRADIKDEVKRRSFCGNLEVLANPVTSPSGFPFQVIQLEGSLSDPAVFDRRKRDCSAGYLVEAYKTASGRIGFRCAAEPVAAYVRKGGDPAATTGRVCLCNGLAAAARDGQRDELPGEPFIATLGQDVSFIKRLLRAPGDSYSAEDVVKFILPEDLPVNRPPRFA
jgi:NAD(P)H-dependent flavin oxidoreductase YrpB (nitropropane dioxygenase family)